MPKPLPVLKRNRMGRQRQRVDHAPEQWCSGGHWGWAHHFSSYKAQYCRKCKAGKQEVLPPKCPACNTRMNYHQWPCVDEETGEHLGDYKLWACDCGHKIDMSEG